MRFPKDGSRSVSKKSEKILRSLLGSSTTAFVLPRRALDDPSANG